VKQQFVKIDQPVARVSTLCIHLQTAEERRAFKINKEEHMTPILGTQPAASALAAGAKAQLTGSEEGEEDAWAKEQEPLLMDLLASNLGIDKKDIADFELNLFDTQPASLGGIKNEFLNSARLDNQATCFVAMEALAQYVENGGLGNDEDISLIALFDHEEIGSQSAQGAGSPVMVEAVRRISSALTDHPHALDPDVFSSTIRRSLVFSVDMAHAIHPNYSSKHEKNHSPKMNAGVVMKTNQNQRYATNGVTGFIVRELTRKANITPVQEFVVRNDCPCGTTIGPIISAATGIRTVDAGMPQLSMHSCREVMGVADLTNCLDLFTAFFTHFREIDDALEG
jgi:aspartyl aminopeptidase